MNDFVGYLPESPEGVRRASSQLSYCAIVLLFVIMKRVDTLPAYHVYYNDKDVKFARTSDLGKYSRAMMPEGKTLLCFEFPCSVGDDVWQSSVEELAEYVVDAFKGDETMDPGDVDGSFVERLTHAYPRFEVGFRENLQTCFSYLSKFKNVISYGRQGGFLYVNTDEVVHQGFVAAQAIGVSSTIKLACWEHFEQNVKCPYNGIKE